MFAKGSLNDHLEKLKVVLKKLQQASLMANAEKRSFKNDSVEYLGYLLSHNGLQLLTHTKTILNPRSSTLQLLNKCKQFLVEYSHINM